MRLSLFLLHPRTFNLFYFYCLTKVLSFSDTYIKPERRAAEESEQHQERALKLARYSTMLDGYSRLRGMQTESRRERIGVLAKERDHAQKVQRHCMCLNIVNAECVQGHSTPKEETQTSPRPGCPLGRAREYIGEHKQPGLQGAVGSHRHY